MCHCSQHNIFVIFQLIGSEIQCMTVLCHCCHHDLPVVFQLLGSVPQCMTFPCHCCQISLSFCKSSEACCRPNRSVPLLPSRSPCHFSTHQKHTPVHHYTLPLLVSS